MASFRFKVRTELGAIKPAVENASEKADHVLAIQAAKDTSPYVPARNLVLDRRTMVKGNQIIYPGPYARYLYRGKLYVDPKTGSPFARYGVTKVETNRNLVFSKAVHSKAQAEWFEASKAQNLQKWLRVYKKAVQDGI